MSTTDKHTLALLQTSLSAAVPLWSARIWKEHDGDLGKILDAPRDELVKLLNEHGDDVLFRSKKKGGTALAFNALAEGLAVLAFAAGGVTAFGLHFEWDGAHCMVTAYKGE